MGREKLKKLSHPKQYQQSNKDLSEISCLSLGNIHDIGKNFDVFFRNSFWFHEIWVYLSHVKDTHDLCILLIQQNSAEIVILKDFHTTYITT